MVDKHQQDLESYFIIKGRFKGVATNTFGLFVVFISLSQKAIENVYVAASHYSSIFDLHPTNPWNIYEDKINQLKWKGEIVTNLSNDLQLLLLNTVKPDMIEEYIEAIHNSNLPKVEHSLTGILAKGIMDKAIAVEIKTERVNYTDIIRIKDERLRKEKEERESKEKEEIRRIQEQRYKVEDGAVILPVHLILAPVSGTPIYEIKAGDLIMIKIDSSTEKGNYFIDLLNTRGPVGEITPIKAITKEITMNTIGEYELLLEIGPGIYGKVTEAEKVKIKKYDVSEDKTRPTTTTAGPTATPFSKTPLPKQQVSEVKDYFIWIVGAITFILAILIMYLIFSGIL